MIARTAGPDRRGGLASVAVLIALIIIGIICAGLLRVALARRAELAREERRLQADWLAGSGLDRARARLGASADYPGETWDVPSADLGGRGPSTVLIRVDRVVDRVVDQPDRRLIRVQADFPSGSTLRARQSREASVTVRTPPR